MGAPAGQSRQQRPHGGPQTAAGSRGATGREQSCRASEPRGEHPQGLAGGACARVESFESAPRALQPALKPSKAPRPAEGKGSVQAYRLEASASTLSSSPGPRPRAEAQRRLRRPPQPHPLIRREDEARLVELTSNARCKLPSRFQAPPWGSDPGMQRCSHFVRSPGRAQPGDETPHHCFNRSAGAKP